MRLLLLGGYRFLGRAVIDSARRRGHAVTVFSSGSTRTADFGDVEWILGDRSHDLERLRARSWDAVIDTCGYLPADVASSAAFLSDATAQYTFVSSISTYALPILRDSTKRQRSARCHPAPIRAKSPTRRTARSRCSANARWKLPCPAAC